MLFVTPECPSSIEACACRPASATYSTAAAEPACSRQEDELAAARLEAEPAAGERARSAVAAQVRCAAAADDSLPDAAAEADSAADDSCQDAPQDAVRAGCSAACCWDARCVPAAPTGGSCRGDCSEPADSSRDDWAVLQADHCAPAARTYGCCPADCLEPADWERAGSAEGDKPDSADWARDDLAAAGWAAVCCCSADLDRADCWAVQDDRFALAVRMDDSHRVADDCRADSAQDDWPASADCPAGDVQEDSYPAARSLRVDFQEL